MSAFNMMREQSQQVIRSELNQQNDELAKRLQERKNKKKRVSISKQNRLSLKSRSTLNLLVLG